MIGGKRNEPFDIDCDHQNAVFGFDHFGSTAAGARKRASENVDHKAKPTPFITRSSAERLQSAAPFIEILWVCRWPALRVGDPTDRHRFAILVIVTELSLGRNTGGNIQHYRITLLRGGSDRQRIGRQTA